MNPILSVCKSRHSDYHSVGIVVEPGMLRSRMNALIEIREVPEKLARRPLCFSCGTIEATMSSLICHIFAGTLPTLGAYVHGPLLPHSQIAFRRQVSGFSEAILIDHPGALTSQASAQLLAP